MVVISKQFDDILGVTSCQIQPLVDFPQMLSFETKTSYSHLESSRCDDFSVTLCFASSFISVAQGSVFRNFPRKTAHARCCGTFIQFIIDVLNVEYIRYIYKILLHY